MVARSNTPTLIAIVGETASGKTNLALRLAQLFSGEIICADAWTLRKKVNIGTAKPSVQDQKLVPHHLLDIIEPDQTFNASNFKSLALREIDSIHKNGKLPFIVGGSGLYVDSVIYDYSFKGSAGNTEHSKKNSAHDLGETMKSEVSRPVYDHLPASLSKDRLQIRQNCLVIGLKIQRDVLKARIDSRVDWMISNGLEKEAEFIYSHYGRKAKALEGIGYNEWKDYFEGDKTINEVRDDIIKDTLSLAKRQRTWFKRNKSIHWFDTPVDLDNIVDLVTTFLNS
jgi:tRNA dimethylallyltransferase